MAAFTWNGWQDSAAYTLAFTLRYIARGLSREEIVNLIQISTKTLDIHIRQIRAKLQIEERVELARYAIGEGLAEV